jgi:hypothetical protein
MKLEDTRLEKKIVRLLRGAGIESIEQVMRSTPNDLRGIPGFGRKMLYHLECELFRLGVLKHSDGARVFS